MQAGDVVELHTSTTFGRPDMEKARLVRKMEETATGAMWYVQFLDDDPDETYLRFVPGEDKEYDLGARMLKPFENPSQ